MIEQLRKYFFNLYRIIPTEVFEGLLIAFFVGTTVIIYLYGWRRGWRKSAGLLLVEYAGLIYCSTVIFRKVNSGVGYNFRPFWSYESIQNGQEILVAQNIMNVVVFLPVGFLIGLITLFHKNKSFMQKYLKGGGIAIVVSLCISVSVEVMQLLLKRGFSEIDDVMHNTLGCLIGFMIVAIIKGIWEFCSYLCIPQWGKKKE